MDHELIEVILYAVLFVLVQTFLMIRYNRNLKENEYKFNVVEPCSKPDLKFSAWPKTRRYD